MTDAEFRDLLRSEFDDMLDAVKNSERFHNPLTPPTRGYPAWDQVFSDSWPLFEGFAQASEDAAERLAENLDTTLIKSLGEEAYNETSTTIEDIRDDLSDWKDSDASKRFRDDWIGHLEDALEYQYQYAVALRGLIDLQWGLIRAAREGIVDVCRQTAARVNEAQAESDRRQRELLGSLVAAVFTIAGGAVTGGILGGIGGALTGFGASASKAVTANAGSTPEEIYSQMFTAVFALAGSIGHEQDEFRKGLRVLQKWTGDLRKDMLPLPLSAGGL